MVDLEFSDLLILNRITDSTLVEKFGSVVNSSFFDAANRLGSLKIKGLIDYDTNSPGQNKVMITELGKKALTDANDASDKDIDELDEKLMDQLRVGNDSISLLEGSTNISSTTVAMHLYKLMHQGYIDASFKNGDVEISKTEKLENYKNKFGESNAPIAGAANDNTNDKEIEKRDDDQIMVEDASETEIQDYPENNLNDSNTNAKINEQPIENNKNNETDENNDDTEQMKKDLLKDDKGRKWSERTSAIVIIIVIIVAVVIYFLK